MTRLLSRRRALHWTVAACAAALLPACQSTVAKKPQIKPRVVDDSAALAARKKQVRDNASGGY